MYFLNITILSPSLQVHEGLGRQDDAVIEDVEEGDHHQHRRGGLRGELPLTGEDNEDRQVDQGSYHANDKTGITTNKIVEVIRHY